MLYILPTYDKSHDLDCTNNPAMCLLESNVFYAAKIYQSISQYKSGARGHFNIKFGDSCYKDKTKVGPTHLKWNISVLILMEFFITGCTGSYQNDNFQCSQWWKMSKWHFRFSAYNGNPYTWKDFFLKDDLDIYTTPSGSLLFTKKVSFALTHQV